MPPRSLARNDYIVEEARRFTCQEHGAQASLSWTSGQLEFCV